MIVHTRLESAHLAGNLLGDPSERDLFVYLPPGYVDPERRGPSRSSGLTDASDPGRLDWQTTSVTMTLATGNGAPARPPADARLPVSRRGLRAV